MKKVILSVAIFASCLFLDFSCNCTGTNVNVAKVENKEIKVKTYKMLNFHEFINMLEYSVRQVFL